MIYNKDKKLLFVLTDEGRAIAGTSTGGSLFTYEYNIKDHLGDTRMVLKDKGDGTSLCLQENHYYPFGMVMQGLGFTMTSAPKNKYLYNGKEMQDDFGLNWEDYNFRMYDPIIGRFHSIDPMAFFTPSISPYGYANNNPIGCIDEDGLGWIRRIYEKTKDAVLTHIGFRRSGNLKAVGTNGKSNVTYHWDLHFNPSTPPNREHSNFPRIEPLDAFIDNDEPKGLMPVRIPILLPKKKNIFEDDHLEDAVLNFPVQFKVKSTEIDTENLQNKQFLDDIIQTLTDFPQMVIEVSCNTADYNKKPMGDVYERASRSRACAIINYLRRNGVKNNFKIGKGQHFFGGDDKRTTNFKNVTNTP